MKKPTLLMAAAVAALFSCAQPDQPVAAPPRDIILITIDTLRADSLGFAGRTDVQTPFLDQLARESVVFTNAHAHNVVTLPSHANILTGLYPYQHGVRDNAGYVLDPKFQTVAAMLKQKGYATGAFVGAFPLDARYGLTPGFDVYDDRYPEGKGTLDFRVAERRGDEVLEVAVEWWNRQQSPRFLWVHLYDPHAPYEPPAEFAKQYASQPYLGEVAYVDAVLARHLGPIIGRDTMLIFTSDHGEALGDHGELTHGLFAYEATLKVPLLVRDAAAAPRQDARPARHIDIVPTILDRAGIPLPEDRLGRSLLANDETPRPTYFEALSASLNRGWAPLVGLIEDGHKYIDLPVPELYDLPNDPSETNNLVAERRRVTAQLRKMLAASAPAQPDQRQSVSAEQSAQLLALGYISGNAAKKNYTTADDPKNLIEIDSMMHRMIELYQRGESERAIALGRDLVRRQPEMAIGHEMLAFMLQQAEMAEAGIETLRKAIASGTSNDAIRIRLGLLLSESGQAEEAVRILSPYADRNEVEILNAYGIALADVGRAAEASATFRRVLQIDQTNASAYQNLGIVMLRSRQVGPAEDYLKRALQIDPELPLALNTLGVLYAQTGRPSEAIAMWQRALAADPRLYDAMFNLAVVAGQNQRWDVAHAALTQFIRTAPGKRYAREMAAAKEMLRQVERQLSS